MIPSRSFAVNSREIHDQIERDKSDYKSGRSGKAQQLGEITSTAEREQRSYLQTLKRRIQPQVENVLDSLGGLHPDQFKSLVSDRFYNPAVMQAALAVTEAIFYGPSDGVTINERIKNWLQDLRRFGVESAYGFAFRASLEDSSKGKDLFVVKAPRDPNDKTLLLELIIGLNLNKLRRKVLNFAYVFGGFSCSPPIVGDDKQVVTWCNNVDHPVNYIVYENIAPAVSMKDFVKTASFDEWLKAYLQVLMALDVAHQDLDFTHYDLHYDNVLLRKLGKTVQLIYSLRGQQIYVVTDSIPTIIDYGGSHLKAETGQSFGEADPGFETYGVSQTKSYPMHDAYKLLMFSGHEMAIQNNAEAFEQWEKLASLFHPGEDMGKVLNLGVEDVFMLPRYPHLERKTHYDLIQAIFEIFPNIPSISTTQVYDLPMLTCGGAGDSGAVGGVGSGVGGVGGGACIGQVQALDEMGIEGGPKADTVFEFYDLMTRLQREQKLGEMQQAADQFIPHYNPALTKALSETKTAIENVSNTFGQMTPTSIAGDPPEVMMDKNATRTYQNYLHQLAFILDKTEDIDLNLKGIVYTLDIYKTEAENSPIMQEVKEMEQDLKAIDQSLSELVQLFGRDYQIYRQFVSRGFPKDAIPWWTTMDEYMMVFGGLGGMGGLAK